MFLTRQYLHANHMNSIPEDEENAKVPPNNRQCSLRIKRVLHAREQHEFTPFDAYTVCKRCESE